MKERTLIKSFAKYVSVSVLGMLAISGYILADTFFVSVKLGTNGLSALNLALPAYNFIYGIAQLIGMGGATKFSVFKNRGETKRANEAFTNTLFLALFFSVIFFTFGLTLSGQITALLGAEGEVYEMAHTYLKTLLLFSPAFILKDIMLCFVRNDKNPNLAMCAMVVSSLSNVLLDYIFIFPCNIGMFGAVLATCLSPIISLSIISFHFILKKASFRAIKTPPRFNLIKNIFSLGVPSLVSQLATGVAMIVYNFLFLNAAGNVGVAAYGIIANISLVVIAVFSGIEQGSQPLLSETHAKNDRPTLKKLLKYSLVTVATVAAVIMSVVYFLTEPIVSIFNSEHSAVLGELAVKGMRLYFSATLCVGFNAVCCVYFTATERALPAQIVSLLRGILLPVPVAFLLSALGGVTGIWMSYPLTELTVSIIALTLLIVFLKKSSVKKDSPPIEQKETAN